MEITKNYPVFHSISTVGIRKHSNQDYLLHPVRTDFTGVGGVGKSMLADFLQVLFIWDTNKIKFGTATVTNEPRDVMGMLHPELNTGYVFVNIEHSENQYIVFGVCLGRNSKPQIKPFLILNHQDWQKGHIGMKSLTFEAPLTNQDFIQNNEIILLNNLFTHLDKKKGLFLHRSKDREELYQWLRKKQIMPMDLSLANNLDAYAKVVQSFSKANSLEIKKSSSLKKFIFEDVADKNHQNYEAQKDEIAKLFQHYKDFQQKTDDFKAKQNYLQVLENLHTTYQKSFFDWQKSQTIFAYQEHQKVKIHFENSTKKLDELSQQMVQVQEEQKRLEKLQESENNELIFRQNELDILEQYKSKVDEKNRTTNRLKGYKIESEKISNKQVKFQADIENHSAKITEVQDKLPKYENQQEDLEQEVDKLKETLKNIEEITGFYTKYQSFEATIQKFSTDEQTYISLQTSWKDELQNLKVLDEFLSGIHQDENSFFQYIIHQKKALSPEQESILYAFKTLKLSPSNTKEYVHQPEELLNPKNYQRIDNEFFWIKLGGISRRIKYVPIQKFDNPENFEKVLQNEAGEVKGKINYLLHELQLLKDLKTKNSSELNEFANKYQIDNQLIKKSLMRLEELKDTFEEIKNQDKINTKYEQQVTNLKAIQEEIAKNKDDISRWQFKKNLLVTQLKENNEKLSELERQINFETREIKALEASLISIKTEIKTQFQEDKLSKLIKRYKQRSKELQSLLTKTQKQITENQNNIILLTEDLTNEKNSHKQLKESFEKTQKIFQNQLAQYHRNFESEIVFAQEEEITEDEIDKLLENKNSSFENYEEEYVKVTDKFPNYRTNDFVKEQIEHKKYSYEILEKRLIQNHKRKEIPELLRIANRGKLKVIETLRKRLINIFFNVKKQYKEYDQQVQRLNDFFRKKKISDELIFEIEFKKGDIRISWVQKLSEQFGYDGAFDKIDDVSEAIAEIFKTITNYSGSEINIRKLLNPMTYFELVPHLWDKDKKDLAGSNSQGYSAIALLCIGRLSIIQPSENTKGLKFIILEELSNISDDNFEMFVKTSIEYGYQILTMTPKPYGYFEDMEWYHYDLSGKSNESRNYPPLGKFKQVRNEVEITHKLEN